MPPATTDTTLLITITFSRSSWLSLRRASTFPNTFSVMHQLWATTHFRTFNKSPNHLLSQHSKLTRERRSEWNLLDCAEPSFSRVCNLFTIRFIINHLLMFFSENNINAKLQLRTKVTLPHYAILSMILLLLLVLMHHAELGHLDPCPVLVDGQYEKAINVGNNCKVTLASLNWSVILGAQTTLFNKFTQGKPPIPSLDPCKIPLESDVLDTRKVSDNPDIILLIVT